MKAVRNSWQGTVSNWQGWLIVIFVSLALAANAQISGKSSPEIKRALTDVNSISQPGFYFINLSTKSHSPVFPSSHLLIFPSSKIPPLLSSYLLQTNIPNFHTYEHLPFFCKIEVKLEQAAKFPIKFRLGDVPYVDYLEGKRDTKYW